MRAQSKSIKDEQTIGSIKKKACKEEAGVRPNMSSQMKLKHSDMFICPQQTNGRCATNRYFQVIGGIHDIESYQGIENDLSMNAQIFGCDFGHLGIILMFIASNLFHIAWGGNYEIFIQNPTAVIRIAHQISDPHFHQVSASLSISFNVLTSYSGIYNWLLGGGFTTNTEIYNGVIILQLQAILMLSSAKIQLHGRGWLRLSFLHTNDGTLRSVQSDFGIKVQGTLFNWPYRIYMSSVPLDTFGLRLNIAIGWFGFLSILWAGHLSFVCIPINSVPRPWPKDLTPFLTFIGGLKQDTASLYLSDIAHHHLAIGVLFIISAHLYASIYKSGFAHRIRDILRQSTNIRIITSQGKSLDLGLGLALAGLSVVTSMVASIISKVTAYPYLSMDYLTVVALYVHHEWIASFLVVSAGAHFGIFTVRHRIVTVDKADPLGRLLSNRAGIISGLSYISLWLGFHTLGVYIHNDAVTAFGQEEKQILIEPVLLSLRLAPGDLLVHHAISVGLHVTGVITIKGAQNGTGSKLMPDKISFGYHFPCDGPGRGGTCDISAWDSFYLAKFWSLNTTAWILFYFQWKHLAMWNNRVLLFEQNSSFLNAWFRDYVWFNSAPLIHSYDTLGSNDLTVWAWTFLAAHLCWATGFMFLISWRGYWQELIDMTLLMHLKTPFLFDIWNANVYTPVALSIVQARFIGLFHFTIGFIVTYAAFIIGATS